MIIRKKLQNFLNIKNSENDDIDNNYDNDKNNKIIIMLEKTKIKNE